jgi:hypothetical protein
MLIFSGRGKQLLINLFALTKSSEVLLPFFGDLDQIKHLRPEMQLAAFTLLESTRANNLEAAREMAVANLDSPNESLRFKARNSLILLRTDAGEEPGEDLSHQVSRLVEDSGLSDYADIMFKILGGRNQEDWQKDLGALNGAIRKAKTTAEFNTLLKILYVRLAQGGNLREAIELRTHHALNHFEGLGAQSRLTESALQNYSKSQTYLSLVAPNLLAKEPHRATRNRRHRLSSLLRSEEQLLIGDSQPWLRYLSLWTFIANGQSRILPTFRAGDRLAIIGPGHVEGPIPWSNFGAVFFLGRKSLKEIGGRDQLPSAVFLNPSELRHWGQFPHRGRTPEGGRLVVGPGGANVCGSRSGEHKEFLTLGGPKSLFLASPLAATRALFEAIRLSPSRIEIFGVDFYSKNNDLEAGERLMAPEIFSVHDVVQDFLWTTALSRVFPIFFADKRVDRSIGKGLDGFFDLRN